MQLTGEIAAKLFDTEQIKIISQSIKFNFSSLVWRAVQ